MTEIDLPKNFSKLIRHNALDLGYLKGITDDDGLWYRIHFFNDNEVIAINHKGFTKIHLLDSNEFLEFLQEIQKEDEKNTFNGRYLTIEKNQNQHNGFIHGRHFFLLDRYLENKQRQAEDYSYYLIENARQGAMRYRYLFFINKDGIIEDIIEIKDWKINSKMKDVDIVDYSIGIRGYQEFALDESQIITIGDLTYDLTDWVKQNKLDPSSILYRIYSKEKYELEIINHHTRFIYCAIPLTKKFRPFMNLNTKNFNMIELLAGAKEEAMVYDSTDTQEKIKQLASKEKTTNKKKKEGETTQKEEQREFLEYKKWGNNDAVIFNDIIFFLNGYFQEYGYDKDDICIYYHHMHHKMYFYSQSRKRIVGNIEFEKDFPKGMPWSKTLSVLEYFCNKRGYKEFKISERTNQLGVNKNTYRFKSWLDAEGLGRDDILIRVYYKLDGKTNKYNRMEILSTEDMRILKTIPLQLDGRPKHAKRSKSSFVIKELV